jgi:phage terminase large subunit
MLTIPKRVEEVFDFKHPDYQAVFQARIDRLATIRKNPKCIPALKVYYRKNIAQFIIDFGITVDPRNLEKGWPTSIPFILFPKQKEWVEWIIDHWMHQRQGITEKTRQMGFSWLTMALSCSLCLFNKGMSIGVGSRKQEYVDVIGDPKSLIQKARMFMQGLPKEFRGGWDVNRNAPHMRMMFPETESLIVGECGDQLGRGNSTSIYFVDESAFIEHPLLVDASLSQTTNCRQDISTPNGMGNSFAQKRHSGALPVFTFHWRDDPRKDQEWYDKQCRELDPVVVAAELDINYSASVEGVVLPSNWVQASIDAHKKLGIEATGAKYGALDVADEGGNKNAFAARKGILLNYLKSWSGKGGDVYRSVVTAFDICDQLGLNSFFYDADGIGSGVRGDARVINDSRDKDQRAIIRDEPFRGSSAVYRPEAQMVPKRQNKDFFANRKAQSYWALRLRFEATYKAVVDKLPYNPDDLISIDSELPELGSLLMQLSQPTYELNNVGKVVIDKNPEGTSSPDLADAVMICYQPGSRALEIWAKLGE